MSHLSKAKADIREQRAAIRERQRQLEHDRQHWKSELDVVATVCRILCCKHFSYFLIL